MITVSRKLIAASVPRKSLSVKAHAHRGGYDLNKDSILEDDFPDVESDGDSQCLFAGDSCSDWSAEQEMSPRQQTECPDPHPVALQFDKMIIGDGPQTKCRRSSLSVMLLEGDGPLASTVTASEPAVRGKSESAVGIELEIYFLEFGLDRRWMLRIRADAQNDQMLVDDLIAESMGKFTVKFPNQRLRGDDAGDYELRFLDDDALNDSDLSEDDLDPALNRNSFFFDFVEICKQKVFRLVLCCTVSPRSSLGVSGQSVPENDDEKECISSLDRTGISESEWSERRGHSMVCCSRSMERIGMEKEQLFVRILIVGPIASDESSVVISLNAQSISSLILRDLFSLLNRKKQSNTFHPQFFQFCYHGKPQRVEDSGPIPNGIKLSDLRQRTLIIFPKTTAEMKADSVDVARAMEYQFVKLANEVTRSEAFKMDKVDESRRKYPVVLVVDPPRNRLLLHKKKSLKIRSVPIDIGNITDIQPHKRVNRRQWTLCYFIGKANAKTHKKQIYEMEDQRERDAMVRKLRYLRVLLKVKKRIMTT